MPYSICIKLNKTPKKHDMYIVQLYSSKVKFLGELNLALIRLSSNPRVCTIDILIVDIPEFYSLILSRDLYENLHGYFPTNCSYIWLPYNGKPNEIRVDREKTYETLGY